MSEQAVIEQPAQANELAVAVQKVSAELAGFDKIAAGLAALKAEHPANVVLDVSKSEGMKAAIRSRAAWREPRIAIEKVRKAAKAPVLALGKTIDNFAENLTAQLRLGEDNYDGQIQAELTRKAEEKKRADEAESRRVLDIHARISQAFECAPGRAFGRPAAAIRDELQAMMAVSIDESKFAEFVDEAKNACAAAVMDLRSMLATQEKQEADAERLRKEREEYERQVADLLKEQAKFAAQQAEQRAAQEARAAAERKEREAREADFREQQRLVDEQQRRVEAERRAIEEAKAVEARRIADEAAATERKRLDDIAAQERAEAAAKAEEERKAAQAERIAREEAEAKEAAKRARAARKLAAAQKAGPRLLAAIRALLEALCASEHMTAAVMADIKSQLAEVGAAIAEAEAA